MIERDLCDPEAAITVGLSGDEFRLVVETFDGGGRDLAARLEPVEDQVLMLSECRRSLRSAASR